MKCLLPVLICLGIIACNHEGHQQNNGATYDNLPKEKPAKSNEEADNATNDLFDKITDSLIKIDFVARSNRYIDSFSNHKAGIAFMQDTAENKILITAGYNAKDRFEKYFIFLVDPKSLEIKINDIETGDYISLEQYRKLNPAH